MEIEEGNTIEITGVYGNRISIKTSHPKNPPATGVIKMNYLLRRLGRGCYYHERTKSGWGTWDIQLEKDSRDEILVDQQYQTEEKPHYYSWVWKRIKNFKN